MFFKIPTCFFVLTYYMIEVSMSRVEHQTVTVNGTVYDSQTGRPLHVIRTPERTASHGAQTMHTQLQHSTTLRRKHSRISHESVVVPARQESKPAQSPAQTVSVHRTPKPQSEVKRSELVSRFAPETPRPASKKVVADIAPTKHHMAQRAAVRMSAKQPVQRVVKPSDVLKKEAVARATAEMKPRDNKSAAHKRPRSNVSRRLSMASAALAILLLGGYFTYLNMPALSTRVAASQAGVNATYPSYHPSGYSLSGPVAYEQGNVSMKFAANTGPQSFTLSQTSSDWDSSAVLDNYILPAAGENYATTRTGGLTIYTYADNAAWVNNGVLYTIKANTTLSNDQIQRIATSL